MGGPSATPDQQKKGINVYMGGIGMQEFFIIVFLGLVIKFHLESKKVGKAQTDRQGQRWLYTLYASLVLVTVSITWASVRPFSIVRGAG